MIFSSSSSLFQFKPSFIFSGCLWYDNFQVRLCAVCVLGNTRICFRWQSEGNRPVLQKGIKILCLESYLHVTILRSKNVTDVLPSQIVVVCLQRTLLFASGLILCKSSSWCKLMARIRQCCCQHGCCVVLEGSAAAGEWEELQIPCDQSLTRSLILYSCLIVLQFSCCCQLLQFSWFFWGGNLSFLLQALPSNWLTLFTVNFSGHIFFIFEASEPKFFTINQKQKLVIITWLFEN